MKKIIIIFLIICMLLPLAAFTRAHRSRALPSVGDLVEGFEVKEIREIPSIGSTGVLLSTKRPELAFCTSPTRTSTALST
ncbi:MAG: hypothetical protein IJJ67_06245 [Oscillospiraceae bacterium]|nr:hypothetical protein [Oscillospiraceae bacterium]